MGASLLDVSRPLRSGMPRAFVYPPPVFEHHVIGVQPNGEPIQATRIEMYSHVGTHIESARHIVAAGPTLDEYSLDRFIGPGRAAALGGTAAGAISVEELDAALPDLATDCFVMLQLADLAEHADEGPHRFLADDAAKWLVDHHVRAVGVDTSTPDRHVSERAHRFDLPVHRILFAANVLIIENLHGPSLSHACGRVFTVHAVPLNLPGSDSSPVRVLLNLDDGD